MPDYIVYFKIGIAVEATDRVTAEQAGQIVIDAMAFREQAVSDDVEFVEVIEP